MKSKLHLLFVQIIRNITMSLCCAAGFHSGMQVSLAKYKKYEKEYYRLSMILNH